MPTKTTLPELNDAQNRAKLIAPIDPSTQPNSKFLTELRALIAEVEPRGLAPAGNRVLSARDLARHLGGSEQWWERHRPKLLAAKLLTRANRRFIGCLRTIQEAIADPNLWADEE